MNPAQMAMMRRASADGTMGDDPTLATRPRVVNPLPTMTPPTGHSTLNAWLGLAANLGSQAIQAFAKNPVYPQVYTGQQQQYYTADQIAAMQRAQAQGTNIQAGTTQGGFYIGNTFVSWTTAAVVGVGLFLLQSKGFSR